MAVVPEVGSGLVDELFRDRVLHGQALRRDVRRFASATELAALFGAESRAIALIAAGAARPDGTKVLALMKAAGESAVSPTGKTLHDGSYPLRLPVMLVVPPERAERVRRLVEYLLSDDAAGFLGRADLLPVPAVARAELLRGWVTADAKSR